MRTSRNRGFLSSSAQIAETTSKGVSLHLRAAALDDVGDVWRLYVAAMKEYVSAIYGWEEDGEEERKLFRDEWPDNCPDTQVLCEGEKIVAAIRVQRKPCCLYLASIEVAPGYQSRGIGTWLITALLREGKSQQLPVELTVFKNDPRARELYERLGFVVVEVDTLHLRMRWRDREHRGHATSLASARP